jgi:hypothetical protein
MKHLKARLEALEVTTTSCEDKQVLSLWHKDWTDGVFDFIEDKSWEPGDPAVNLAELAWIHHSTTGKKNLRDLTFDEFWEVEVRGVDPEFL